MSKNYNEQVLERAAVLEISLLLALEFLPSELEGAQVKFDQPEVLLSPNSKPTRRGYRRLRLVSNDGAQVGSADFAVDELMGDILLSVRLGSHGDLQASAGKRLVSLSYPKIAIESYVNNDVRYFLYSGDEVGSLIEDEWVDSFLKSKAPEPEDYLSPIEAEKRKGKFRQEYGFWSKFISSLHSSWYEGYVTKRYVEGRLKILKSRNKSWGGYLELRGQSKSDWCIPACLQMLLGFYRYSYCQGEMAKLLDLRGNAVQRGEEQQVISSLERVTGGNLKGKLNAYPDWLDVKEEIDKGRPLMCLTDDHCLTAVGYKQAEISLLDGTDKLSIKGMEIKDPDPLEKGTVFPWYSFGVQPFRIIFSASLSHLHELDADRSEWLLASSRALLEGEDLHSVGSPRAVLRLYRPGVEGCNWFVGLTNGNLASGFLMFDGDLELRGIYRIEGQHVWANLFNEEALRNQFEVDHPGKKVVKAALVLEKEEERAQVAWNIKARTHMGQIEESTPVKAEAARIKTHVTRSRI